VPSQAAKKKQSQIRRKFESILRVSLVRASAKNFVRFVVPEFRHSGERRNPGISIYSRPRLRRGDHQGGQTVTDKIMDNCYMSTGWANLAVKMQSRNQGSFG
jgi:hypothetical protein